jgi:lipid-binding SYLF domain-containing protein
MLGPWQAHASGVSAAEVDGKTAGYYTSVAGSFGLQIGVQSFSYALFFMSDETLKYLDNSSGWEIGIGPSIVVVDSGAAGKFSTTTAKDEIYAFIYGQEGLMAGMGIEGSKITEFTPDN